ncbi:MAG: Spy/CpxP family protein refolding chaperone [Magnetococcus sp. DMHC-6]
MKKFQNNRFLGIATAIALALGTGMAGMAFAEESQSVSAPMAVDAGQVSAVVAPVSEAAPAPAEEKAPEPQVADAQAPVAAPPEAMAPAVDGSAAPGGMPGMPMSAGGPNGGYPGMMMPGHCAQMHGKGAAPGMQGAVGNPSVTNTEGKAGQESVQASAQNNTRGPGPAFSPPQKMRFGGGMASLMGLARTHNNPHSIPAYLNWVRAGLVITEAQAESWKSFVDSVRKDVEVKMQLGVESGRATYKDSLELVDARLEQSKRLIAAREEVLNAFKALYGSLDEKQKRLVDELSGACSPVSAPVPVGAQSPAS